MLQRLDRTDHNVVVVEVQSRVTPIRGETSTEYDDGLLATAASIMAVAYAVALAAAVITFMANGEALFAVVVSIGFAVVYFAVPLLLTRVRARHDARWRSDPGQRQSHKVEVFTGLIRRSEALAQMLIVPIAVGFAFICFAVIWMVVRP